MYGYSNRIQESEQLTIKITKSTKLFTTVKNGKKKQNKVRDAITSKDQRT